MVAGTKEPATLTPCVLCQAHLRGRSSFIKIPNAMLDTKNENSLTANNNAGQTALTGAASGNRLKATDVIGLFPDNEVKSALSLSSVSRESPLYNFLGLFEIAKGYICFNEGINERIGEDFNTLMKSMDFYLELIKTTFENDL